MATSFCFVYKMKQVKLLCCSKKQS